MVPTCLRFDEADQGCEVVTGVIIQIIIISAVWLKGFVFQDMLLTPQTLTDTLLSGSQTCAVVGGRARTVFAARSDELFIIDAI